MEQTIKRKERLTFTDQLRVTFRGVLEPSAHFLDRLGIHPNMLTLSGLLGTTAGAMLVATGNLRVGGILAMFTGLFDALDGPLARVRGEPEDFGAFVDSVTDRYSELVIFAGLLWHFIQSEQWLGAMLVFAAAAGSVMVSYVRARAQGLGFEAKVGLLTRVERYLIIGPSLLFNIPLVGVAIVAAGANFTAFQRIFYVRRQSRSRREKKE